MVLWNSTSTVYEIYSVVFWKVSSHLWLLKILTMIKKKKIMERSQAFLGCGRLFNAGECEDLNWVLQILRTWLGQSLVCYHGECSSVICTRANLHFEGKNTTFQFHHSNRIQHSLLQSSTNQSQKSPSTSSPPSKSAQTHPVTNRNSVSFCVVWESLSLLVAKVYLINFTKLCG